MQSFHDLQLREFDGRRGKPIYVAILGIVYDVSAVPESRNLYGPGGPYHVFAGRECARALAVLRVARKDCNDQVKDLDQTALQTLDNWINKFKAKYPVVGQVQRKKRSLRRFLPFVGGAILLSAVLLAQGSRRSKS